MPRVEKFDSLDEMFESMRKKEEELASKILPLQREVVWGSHWVTYYPEEGLVVYGYVMTPKEFKKSEMDAGADEEEASDSMDRVLDLYERGYRFGKCYSIVEVEGEYGSTHLASIMGCITPEQFEEAQEHDWKFVNDVPVWFRDLWDRGNREQAEQREREKDTSHATENEDSATDPSPSESSEEGTGSAGTGEVAGGEVGERE